MQTARAVEQLRTGSRTTRFALALTCPTTTRPRARSTLSYVRVVYTPGVVDAVAVNGNKAIQITITDVSRFPANLPVVISYAVTGCGRRAAAFLRAAAALLHCCAAALLAAAPTPTPRLLRRGAPLTPPPPRLCSATGGTGLGFIQVTGPPAPKPTGPSPVAGVGPAALGFPLLVPSSTILAGWADPSAQAGPVGVVGVKPLFPSQPLRGAALPAALTPGNWSSVAEVASKRIEASTFTCTLPDLRLAAGAPTAKRPDCVTQGGGLEAIVSTTRFATANAKVPIAVSAPGA